MASPLRSTGTMRATSRRAAPDLTVLPGRRRVAWFAVSLVVLVGGVLIGVVLLHTRLAERQLEIDSLEQAVRSEQEQFDMLRAQRAELRAPNRLAEYATALGMSPGDEIEYLPVDPMVLAITIARTGELPPSAETGPGENTRMRPLEQFRLVKKVSAEAP